MYQSETRRWQDEGKNNLMCPRAVKGVRCGVRWSHVDWRLMRATFRMAESPLTLLETYCNSFRCVPPWREPSPTLCSSTAGVLSETGADTCHFTLARKQRRVACPRVGACVRLG
jgi:hypothetical protein